MDRFELARETICQLNESSQPVSRKPRSQNKKSSHVNTGLANFTAYVEHLIGGSNVKDKAVRQHHHQALGEFKVLAGKLGSILTYPIDEMLSSYLKQLEKCVTLVLQQQMHQGHNKLTTYVNHAKLENLKLQKSMKTLLRDSQPRVIEQESRYTQTDMPYRRNNNDSTSMVFQSYSTAQTQRPTTAKPTNEQMVTIPKGRLQALSMTVEDLLEQRSILISQVDALKRNLQQTDIEGSIIAYRKQLKNNTLQYFLPKLKRNARQSILQQERGQPTGQFEFEALSKQKSIISFLEVCYHHDALNLLKSATLHEHPFRLLRTIRAVMDSLTLDLQQPTKALCYFEFGHYLHQWFRCFELPYALNKRSTDVELDKIKFVLALQDYHLSKLWDVVLFRQLMCNIYEFDQVDFLVKARWSLLKRPQVDQASGSEIVKFITLDSCKATITGLLSRYPAAVTKMILQKLSKTQVKIRNQYKVDSAYALRLAIDLYKELKAQKKTAFLAQSLASFTLQGLAELLRTQFPDLKEQLIDRIYFECANARLSRSQQIWDYCVERGYFNGRIVPLNHEEPQLANNDSLKECVKEYDKLTPLISSFRKSLAVRGSTLLLETEQQLEITKLWGSEVPQVLQYFSRLESLIRDSVMISLQQNLHTHQRDPQLQYSMLSGLLRSISNKLTLWKKLNSKSHLFNEYVVTCTKRLQKMVRTCLPYHDIHRSVREKLDNPTTD